MRIAFTRWRSGSLFNRPSPRKRLLPKKKTSSGFEFVSGLADGASAMPAKWSRPVFSFRFYEGKISRALIVIRRLPWGKAERLSIRRQGSCCGRWATNAFAALAQSGFGHLMLAQCKPEMAHRDPTAWLA